MDKGNINITGDNLPNGHIELDKKTGDEYFVFDDENKIEVSSYVQGLTLKNPQKLFNAPVDGNGSS